MDGECMEQKWLGNSAEAVASERQGLNVRRRNECENLVPQFRGNKGLRSPGSSGSTRLSALASSLERKVHGKASDSSLYLKFQWHVSV